MGGTANELKGPDLEAGIEAKELREGEPLLGHAGGEPVVLVKRGAECFAVGATCSHYSGPLAEGLVVGTSLRCPWHHARFDLRTGAALGGPGLNPIPCYQVAEEGGRLRVLGKRPTTAPLPRPTSRPDGSPRPAPLAAPADLRRVVVVGSGPAGAVVADTLRAEGFGGQVVLVGEEGIPVDRPNLSKDYLAGTAPEEWLPLRDEAALREREVQLVQGRAVRLDLRARRVQVEAAGGNQVLEYDGLVLATGAAPVRLPLPGAELPHVHVLRTVADSRRIIAAAGGARRAVLIGGGFIGLEAAAALRARNLEVTVLLREVVPLERVLGERLGRFVEDLHVEHGVVFRRDLPVAIEPGPAGHACNVRLASGGSLPADLVVMGVGVRPRVELAEQAGLRVENGIVVDEQLETASKGVFAVGDVARFPWRPTGALTRVEHFVHAQRMAFAAARNLLGAGEPFRFTPFFWSQHYDLAINYSGAGPWERVKLVGDPAKRDLLAVYRSAEGRPVALASIYRDQESLRFEELLERGDDQALESFLTSLGLGE